LSEAMATRFPTLAKLSLPKLSVSHVVAAAIAAITLFVLFRVLTRLVRVSGIRWVAVRDDADPMACPDAATDYRTWSTRRAIG
jgi:hypothetical protein